MEQRVLKSGLLSSVVYRDDSVNTLTDKEAIELQASLQSVEAGMQSDTNDLNVICTAMHKAIDLKDLFSKSIEDNANQVTASMLLSEFSAIHKDALGTEVVFAKNLNSDNALANLEAGLQSVSSFIDTLKKLARKIWEALAAAAKWFWSNVKKLITWLFSSRRKAEEKQKENTAIKRFLIASETVKKKFEDKTSDTDSMSNDELEILSNEIEEEMKSVFGEQYKEDGNPFKGINDTFKETFELFKEIDKSLMMAKINIKTSDAVDAAAISMVNKVLSDNKLLNNISAITTIARTSKMFEEAPTENTVFISKDFSLESVLGKSYYNNEWRIRYAFNNTDEWPDKINTALNKITTFKDKDVRIDLINAVFASAFNLEAYDVLSGLGNGRAYGGGIVKYLVKYLKKIYQSYGAAFESINEESLLISENSLNSDELHQAINNLDETSLLREYANSIGTGIGLLAAIPIRFSISGNDINCDWINYLVSGTCKIDAIDQSYFKKEIEDILIAKNDDSIIGRNFILREAVQSMKEGSASVKKIGSSNLEKELMVEISGLEKSYASLLEMIDSYIKWFGEVDSVKIARNGETFNNIFKVIQHINKVLPSTPLLMVSQNQAILNSIIDSLDFEQEIMKAFKKVVSED